MDLKQRDNESFIDWKIRITSAKIEKLIDLDWIEIVELLGLDCSGDHLRKVSYGLYEAKNHYEEKLISGLSDEFQQEFEEKQIELQKLKYQFQDQRREFNNPVRIQARIDHLKQEIINEIHKLNKTKPLTWFEKLSFVHSESPEGLLLLSDTHYGVFTSNYWNKFDNEEFKRRMKKLITKSITYLQNHDIKVLHLFLLGDLINGLIHTITRINNTEDAVTQTIQVSEILSEVICELASEFSVVKIYNVRGNHDRVTPNKKDEIAKESFNDLIPWYLKARLSNVKNIEFMKNVIDDEIIIADIAGQKVFGVHGHKDKVSNVVQNLTLMTKQFPNYIVMGHTHHHEENEIHEVEVIVNSSFSGVDEYSKDIRKTSKAAQKLIVFDQNEGRLCTYNIRLDN